ncbi:MAG: 30S ribosomal protein S2 [bacterium]
MADKADIKELFKAGAHFGHQRSRTDARSSEYIYAFKNRIAVIDLEKTQKLINDSLSFISKRAQEGAVFLFVGTKLQAQEAVKKYAKELEMPYVIERWPGGLLTNFEIVFKSIKKMVKTEEDLAEGKFEHLTKKERLKIDKDLRKSELIFGGLKKLEKMPDVLIAVDASKESIAIKEAQNKKIPVIAICDTNTNPRIIDYPIVSNDDSTSSVDLVLGLIAKEIKENYIPRVKEETKVEERVEKAIAKEENKSKDKKKAA